MTYVVQYIFAGVLTFVFIAEIMKMYIVFTRMTALKSMWRWTAITLMGLHSVIAMSAFFSIADPMQMVASVPLAVWLLMAAFMVRSLDDCWIILFHKSTNRWER